MCDINPDRHVWTVEEVAALSGFSRAFLQEMVERGAVESIRLGRRILIPKSAVRGLIEAAGGCRCDRPE